MVCDLRTVSPKVLPNENFESIVANFSKRDRFIPKNIILEYAKRNPLAILAPERKVAETIGAVMNIAMILDETGPMTNEGGPADRVNSKVANGAEARTQKTAPEPESPSDWESEIDLAHIEDEELRTEVMTVLRKHSSMWDGSLCTISATEHRIDLEPGTRPIRSMPSLQGPAMRERIKAEVSKCST